MAEAKTLEEYIEHNHNGSQREFAESNKVKPPQVTQWLKKDIVVVNSKMYSFRRELE